MRAMILDAPGQPLRVAELPVPTPNPEQVLIRVHACGICRTDLHIVDGELTQLPSPQLPKLLMLSCSGKINGAAVLVVNHE